MSAQADQNTSRGTVSKSRGLATQLWSAAQHAASALQPRQPPAALCTAKQWGRHQLCQRLPSTQLTHSRPEPLAVLSMVGREYPAILTAALAVCVCS